MKFSMLVPCGNCGNQVTVETTGDERYPDAKCGVCGTVTFISDDGRVSRRAFRRAEVELSREDWSVAVILAAMAVECELAYIYSKWKAIESDLLLNEITPTHAKLWEEEFRKLNTASQRLDAVSKMLTSVLSRNFRPQTITMRISILRF